MTKIRNGSKSGVKLNDKSRENHKGKRKQKFAVGTEGTWLKEMMPVSKQQHEGTHQVNTGSFGTSKLIVSDCENPEVFEGGEKMHIQSPPRPAKESRIKKRRKHRANKRERSQVHKKNLGKARSTIAVLKPFGLRVLRSRTTSSTNVSIPHTQKWKMKLKTKSKQQSEDRQRRRGMVPTDSHLENSNNNTIKKWICQKNELLKKEKEAKRKQRRLERAAGKRQELDKQKRQKESEEKIKLWMLKKGIIRTQDSNKCTVSFDANAGGQNSKTSPPIIDMVRKSLSQSPSKSIKSEVQVSDEKLEVKQKNKLFLGTAKSRTGILASKDQMVSLCKMMSTLDQGSECGNLVSQKSNSKNKLVHRDINEKSLSTSMPIKLERKSPVSLSNISQVKEQNNDCSRIGKHLVYQLPFNEKLSRKAKEFKQVQAKIEEQKTELDKNLQSVPALATNQIQSIMDNKNNVIIAKETNTSPNILLTSKFTDAISNPEWLQEAMVTPAVKNWFVHRLEEQAMHGADSNSLVQDVQLCKEHKHNISSLYGRSFRTAEERLLALKQSHTFKDKDAGAGESSKITLSAPNINLSQRPSLWGKEKIKE
ncbi:titin homolog [Mobula hypostoma]|uniref:titin homolog n=1 Tax=Mobula hypostoma TaxID=723540 RepID=UPI002FC36C4D